MSDKPNIYAYCDAMCKWETVHKEDFNAQLENETPIQLDSRGAATLNELNVPYTLYKKGSSNDSWGINFEIDYLLSGYAESIEANPDTAHNFTDYNGKSYSLPKIPVDGNYIKYIITDAEFYDAATTGGTSNKYYSVKLKYRTANTDWQDGSLCVQLASGVGKSNIAYGYALASNVASVSTKGKIVSEIDDIKARLDNLGFKQGTVYFNGEAVDSAIGSVRKQGKYAILSFITVNRNVNVVSVPDDFKPKNPVDFFGLVLANSSVTYLVMAKNGTIKTSTQNIRVVNVGYEIA